MGMGCATPSLSIILSSIHSPFIPNKTNLSSSPPPFLKRKPRIKIKTKPLSSALEEEPTFQNPCVTKLEAFYYHTQLPSGSLSARLMKPEDTDLVVALLSQSFAESMMLPAALFTFLIKNYLLERITLMPHTATLVAFFQQNNAQNLLLAGTVEVSFNLTGPTPTPNHSPYICNMSVTKQLRRRGIGWHLLKASEQLIAEMSSSREVYLHCRMIDIAPLNMYTKAGYHIIKTDSILILLTLQRRKHLMRKELTVSENPPSNIADSGEESK